MGQLEQFLGVGQFMPHGHCYLWDPGLIWLNVLSDALIAAAYYSIPFTLMLIVRQRKDLAFNWMFVCFALFIVACGTTHLLELVTVWIPAYWFLGAIKAVTALTSIPTAILLVTLLPKIRQIPSLADVERSNLLFKGLFDNSPDAVITIDEQGRIQLANGHVEEMFGYSRQELLGSPVEMLLPERFHDIHQHHRDQFMLHPKQRPMGAGLELYGRRRDGSEFPVDLVLSPMRREGGLSVIGIIRDVTERKRAEASLARLTESLEQRVRERTSQLESANAALKAEISQRVQTDAALRASEQRYRSLVAAASSVVWLADSDGRFAHPQPGWEAFTGQDFEHHGGFGWIEAIHLDDREQTQTLWNEAVSNRSNFHAEARLWTAAARDYHYVLLRAVPIVEENGEIREWVGAVTDVEEQKRAEEMLAKNEELQEQNVRIQEANRLKSEFVATMSHELRTPLNSIIGFSEFLFDEKPGSLNPRQKDYLEDIQTSARHLLRLINDVLDLSKIEAGRMELYPESFQVAQAIDEVVSVLRAQAIKKRITIKAGTTTDVGYVILDLGKFKQLLFNLISNAVKFTPDGGLVEVAAELDGRTAFRLKVQDTGIGIRQDDLGRLFIDFHQLDSGLSRRFEGTGLGLALSKRIVEMHGGTISVESEPGQGSTFIVVLPVEVGGTAQ